LRRNVTAQAASTWWSARLFLWNTVYLERAIGALRQQGRQIDEGLLKHVAPVHWNHINLTGDYSWRQNKRVEKGRFPATQDLA
jgi:Tn3 transposase DDE domain